MDQIDLVDIKRRLHDWRNHSPAILFGLLDSIVSSGTSMKAIVLSRIVLSVKAISEINIQKERLTCAMYNWNDYGRVVEKAKQVFRQLTQLMKEEQAAIDNQRAGKPNEQKRVKLFQGFQETFNGYVQRLPYLNALGQALLNNVPMGDYTLEDLKKLAVNLEKEIYLKHLYKQQRKMQYELDVKTLLQYLKRDKTGSVTTRLFTGAFTPCQAAKLLADDWADDKTKREQSKAQQEGLEAQQIGFYDELQKREMEGVEGKLCKGCNQKKVYLVAEQQTRASDEPMTKFFRCFNCNDKFRI